MARNFHQHVWLRFDFPPNATFSKLHVLKSYQFFRETVYPLSLNLRYLVHPFCRTSYDPCIFKFERKHGKYQKPSQVRSKKRASLLPMAERMEDHVQERLLRQSHGTVALWQQKFCIAKAKQI